MVKKNSIDCTETKKIDPEMYINCRRWIRGFLRWYGYECPTNDRVTLREEAVRKLNEIDKRNRSNEDFNSSKSDGVAREIKKIKPFRHSISSDDSVVTEIEKRIPASDVKNYIKKINGSNQMVEFVFEKKLTASDVEKGQGRLLMPFLQVHRRYILNQIEKREKVRLYLPPSQQHYDLPLTQWPTNRPRNYALTSKWNIVVKEKGLQKDMVVQLWAFHVDDAPCLLLVHSGDINHNTTDIDDCYASTSYGGGNACEATGDDDVIYGTRRSGGVVIREPTVVETPREEKESSRSRKGKEKMHEF